MTTYLFIWTILAGAGANAGSIYNPQFQWKQDWVNAGSFDSQDACHRAASNLGVGRASYRCISKDDGGVK